VVLQLLGFVLLWMVKLLGQWLCAPVVGLLFAYLLIFDLLLMENWRRYIVMKACYLPMN